MKFSYETIVSLIYSHYYIFSVNAKGLYDGAMGFKLGKVRIFNSSGSFYRGYVYSKNGDKHEVDIRYSPYKPFSYLTYTGLCMRIYKSGINTEIVRLKSQGYDTNGESNSKRMIKERQFIDAVFIKVSNEQIPSSLGEYHKKYEPISNFNPLTSDGIFESLFSCGFVNGVLILTGNFPSLTRFDCVASFLGYPFKDKVDIVDVDITTMDENKTIIKMGEIDVICDNKDYNPDILGKGTDTNNMKFVHQLIPFELKPMNILCKLMFCLYLTFINFLFYIKKQKFSREQSMRQIIEWCNLVAVKPLDW